MKSIENQDRFFKKSLNRTDCDVRTVRTIRTKLFCEYTEANSLVDQVWSRSAGGERANPLLNVLRMLAQKSMNVVWIDISPMCDPNISLFHISKTSGFLQSDNKINPFFVAIQFKKLFSFDFLFIFIVFVYSACWLKTFTHQNLTL